MKLSEDFNGADLRNVCTEAGTPKYTPLPCIYMVHAVMLEFSISDFTVLRFLPSLLSGMFAIRAERDYVVSEDFMKAVRKVSESKKLETKMDYKQL